MTVSNTDELRPAALAVIVAVPGDMPFANPVLSTVTAPPELEKLKTTPGTAFPSCVLGNRLKLLGASHRDGRCLWRDRNRGYYGRS